LFYQCADNRLDAIDPASGRTRWSAELATGAQSLPHIEGGLALVAVGPNTSGTDGVIAFRAADGRHRWQAPLDPPIPGVDAHLSMAAGLVYLAGDDGALHAIDATSGKPQWTVNLATAAREPSRTPTRRAGSS
jgi:outer membrane protein assembly factor BamB